jgi:hypothetical protein
MVANHRKEDGIHHLTTIEIAKAQKKDHQIYSKKMQKHQNRIHSIIPASLQIGQSVAITIT